MIRKEIALGELAILAGTRALLGAGVGLLLADRMGRSQRRTVGGALLLIGLVTTIPLAIDLFAGGQDAVPEAIAPKEDLRSKT